MSKLIFLEVEEQMKKYDQLIDLGRTPAEAEIELMQKPAWDDYWMGLVFYIAMRSPDAQTKQGCIIVDWDTKTQIGGGYNGHPRGLDGLPRHRANTKLIDGTIQGKPDKYDCMLHADENCIGRVTQRSDNAVMYATMTPCERCFSQAMNSPLFRLRRIVYFEQRDFHVTDYLIQKWNAQHIREDEKIRIEQYNPLHDGLNAAQVLEQAIRYMQLRAENYQTLKRAVTTSYRDINKQS